LAIKALPLDLSYLVFADTELLGHLLAGLSHARLVILGVYESEKNLPALLFREWRVNCLRWHNSSSLGKDGTWQVAYTGRGALTWPRHRLAD
jgi:hypothetical protein